MNFSRQWPKRHSENERDSVAHRVAGIWIERSFLQLHVLSAERPR